MQKIKPHLFNRLSVLKLLIDNDNIVFVRQSSENSTLINAVFHTQFEDFKRSEKSEFIRDNIIKHKRFMDDINVELQKEYENSIKKSTLEFLYDTFDIKDVLNSKNIYNYVKEFEDLKNVSEDKISKLTNELLKFKDLIIDYNFKKIISSKELLSKLFEINILCLDPSSRMLINKENQYERSIILIEYNDEHLYEPVGKMVDDNILFEFHNDENVIINL